MPIMFFFFFFFILMLLQSFYFLFSTICNELCWTFSVVICQDPRAGNQCLKILSCSLLGTSALTVPSSEVLGKSIVSVHATDASTRRHLCQHMWCMLILSLCTSSRWWEQLCVYCFFTVLQQWCLFRNLKAWKAVFISES